MLELNCLKGGNKSKLWKDINILDQYCYAIDICYLIIRLRGHGQKYIQLKISKYVTTNKPLRNPVTVYIDLSLSH